VTKNVWLPKAIGRRALLIADFTVRDQAYVLTFGSVFFNLPLGSSFPSF
jgi:hypothetical protein